MTQRDSVHGGLAAASPLRRTRRWWVAAVVCAAWVCPVGSLATVTPSAASVSGESATVAAALFAKVRPAVIGVRTELADSGETVSSGSGFFVDAQGRAVTNYHVVAGYLEQPERHRLQASLADGRMVALRVVSFHVVADLAIVQADLRTPSFLPLPAEDRSLRVGTRIHAFGDPERFGVTMVNGHFSSRLDAIGMERLHFTGSLNGGMSGGPSVDAQGAVVGINASRMGAREQISFLVPAYRASALHRAVVAGETLATTTASDLTRAQLTAFQREVLDEAMRTPWPTRARGPYQAPVFLTDRLRCANTRGPETAERGVPTPMIVQRHVCAPFRWITLFDGFSAGGLSYAQTYLKRQTLNGFQFNHAVQAALLDDLEMSWGTLMAKPVCTDRTTRAGPRGTLPVRLIWCAQAYRNIEGLYDVSVALVTRDRPDEALVIRLTLLGVTWQTGIAYTRRLLETLR
jgi:serine protease Do